MAASAPRSYWIHWPSPDADQRVARLLSSVFSGRLPSFPLATTEAAVSGVRSAATMDGRGELYGGLGSVRSLVHASARTTLTASVAFNRASRLDSLNLKFILGLLLTCFVGNRKGRRELEDFLGFAGGPADVATYIALVPWLCDTAFRRLCSEQRDRIFVDGSAMLLASAVLHRSHRPIACASGAS